MSQYQSQLDAERLLHLSEEVSRVAGSLAKLSRDFAPPAGPATFEPQSDAPEVSEDAVNWLIDIRRQRERFLPKGLFADPAWDILLDLLKAEIKQQRVSVSSLCIAAAVPATTALRYINGLAQQGLIVRKPDPMDGRRVFVELSVDLSHALRRYFADVVQAPQSRKIADLR